MNKVLIVVILVKSTVFFAVMRNKAIMMPWFPSFNPSTLSP